jgi:hypothetical protein
MGKYEKKVHNFYWLRLRIPSDLFLPGFPKPGGKRPLERYSHMWKDNTVLTILSEGVYWIHVAQYSDQRLKFCELGNEPSGYTESVEFFG